MKLTVARLHAALYRDASESMEAAFIFRERYAVAVRNHRVLSLLAAQLYNLVRDLVVLAGVCVATPVAHNLQSSEHLTNGEEANDLGSDNSGVDQLLVVNVPYPVEQRAGAERVGRGSGGVECAAGDLAALTRGWK